VLRLASLFKASRSLVRFRRHGDGLGLAAYSSTARLIAQYVGGFGE